MAEKKGVGVGRGVGAMVRVQGNSGGYGTRHNAMMGSTLKGFEKTA